MKPPNVDAELIMTALNELWSTNEMVLGKLHVRDHLINIIEAARADAWDEGARWAAVEMGIYPNEKQQWLVPSDNPYRKVSH